MGKRPDNSEPTIPDGATVAPPIEAPRMPARANLPAVRQHFDPAMMHRQNMDDAGLDFETSLPHTTADERRALANVLNVGGEKLQTMANVVLEMVHVTVAPVDYTDQQTGELRPGLRVIISTADGQHYSCGGIAPVRAIRRICAIYGQPPFAPPVKIRVKPVPMGDGKSTYTLEVV
jgi:hypothetical protein